MKKNEVKLGDLAKDEVTGLKGIVTAKSQNLFGCDRAFIQPQMGKDGKIADGFWVDEQSIKVLKAGVVKGHDALRPKVEVTPAQKPGGPMSRIK